MHWRRSDRRFFDFSTLTLLGLVAVLFISLPGGCGDSDADDGAETVNNEAVSEPTAPPMLEIVEPEPGDLDNVSPPEQPVDEPDEPSADEGEEESIEPENTGPAAPGGVYVVQEGDTLYGIAVQFSVTMDQLMIANDMDNPDTLQIGQELQIP